MAITKKDILPLLPQLIKQKKYTNYAKRKIEAEIQKIKAEILNDFDKHPVTKEIDQGINSSNISGTLGGVTNLYSFIGFPSGSKPTQAIRELLKKININQMISPTGKIIYKIDFPTAEDIFDATPLPWAVGRSWAKGIEQGLSGLGYYLKITKNSRSGEGIQSKKKVRQIKFRNTKYISDIIGKYKTEIKRLEKLIL